MFHSSLLGIHVANDDPLFPGRSEERVSGIPLGGGRSRCNGSLVTSPRRLTQTWNASALSRVILRRSVLRASETYGVQQNRYSTTISKCLWDTSASLPRPSIAAYKVSTLSQSSFTSPNRIAPSRLPVVLPSSIPVNSSIVIRVSAAGST